MSHGWYGGVFGIRAEHIKAWLRGAEKEEDLGTSGENVGAGKTWRKFVGLCTTVWRKGTIPQQM